MKNLLFGILVLFSCLINAEQRFTDKDRATFMEETKLDAQVFKAQNQGKFDLVLLKPFILQGLEQNNLNHKFSKAEMVFIKGELEKYMKDPANVNDEEKFFKTLDGALAEISKKALEKIKVGGICNELDCDKKLQCINDPKQDTQGLKCSAGAKECKIDSDCCSDNCEESKVKGKKLCAPIKRCYLPVKLGDSCLNNPACEQGNCLPFNSNTIGIGECNQANGKCSKNNECCSNLCSNKKCVENLVCKSCVSRGDKAENGKKCCEGLYIGEGGLCVPDVPPIVPPQVNNTKPSMLKNIFGLFISNANAQANLIDNPDEAYNKVNSDRDKYSNYTAKSADKDIVDFKKMPKFGFKLKSDFQTCDMHFREDFYNYLLENKLFDQEIALLAFDFNLLGEPNSDYWRTQKNNELTSINGRLNAIAKKHDDIRTKTNTKIDEINRKLKCMCVDVIGPTKTTKENADFFAKSCDDFKSAFAGDQNQASCKNLDGETKSYNEKCNPIVDGMKQTDCNELKIALDQKTNVCAQTPVEPTFLDDNKAGDASSVKSKRLLVYFTASMSSFNQTLTVDNTKIYQGIAGLKNWIEKEGYAKLTSTDKKTYDLGDFTTVGGDDPRNGMGVAVASALIAAGVLAVVGGFATGSMISAWAAAGIITATAVAAGGGFWMIASLKGAWISKRPEVADNFLRTHECGKKGKATCTDWKRKLSQPYNTVCDSHISANACVKNFLVYQGVYKQADSEEVGTGTRYIVDPFLPVGVPRSVILRNQGDHAKNLEAGFDRALKAMNGKMIHDEISSNVMWAEFIDQYMVKQYAPELGSNPADDYVLTETIETKIKDAAKKFAVDQKFFTADDKDNLNNFADYALEFHFKWPKTSLQDEVSYPTVALDTYLDFMSNGVAAKLSAGGASAAMAFGGLNSKYLQDYLSTLKLYQEQAGSLDKTQQSALQNEINKTQLAISNNNALAAAISTGSDLTALNKDGVTGSGNKMGTSGGSLSQGQLDFARAVGDYRKLRNDQVRKADIYAKATLGSKNTEDGKARAVAVSKALTSFSSKFNSPLTASLGSSSLGAPGASTTNANSGIKYIGLPSSNGLSKGGYAPPSGPTGSSGTKSSSSSSSSADAGGAGNASSDEDSRKLADAINARDKANENKFKATDDNSLFEKVTKAYIRNYDKVLDKKKQEKEVIENKQQK